MAACIHAVGLMYYICRYKLYGGAVDLVHEHLTILIEDVKCGLSHMSRVKLMFDEHCSAIYCPYCYDKSFRPSDHFDVRLSHWRGALNGHS